VRGASPRRVVHEQDPTLLKPFIEARRSWRRPAAAPSPPRAASGALPAGDAARRRRADVHLEPHADADRAAGLLRPPGDRRADRPFGRAQPAGARGRRREGVPHVVGGSRTRRTSTTCFVQNRDLIDTDKVETQLVALATRWSSASAHRAFVCEGTNFSSWATPSSRHRAAVLRHRDHDALGVRGGGAARDDRRLHVRGGKTM